MQSHDKEGGEDDIGEEGDEVDHFPIRLTIIKIVTWIVHIDNVHISSSLLKEAKSKPLDAHDKDYNQSISVLIFRIFVIPPAFLSQGL